MCSKRHQRLSPDQIIWAAWIPLYALAFVAMFLVNREPEAHLNDTSPYYLTFLSLDPWATGLAIALLLVAPFLAKPFFDSWWESSVTWVTHHRLPAAIAVLVFLGLGARFVYQADPLTIDEYIMYFQAQLFSRGKLHASYPVPLMPWLIPPEADYTLLSVSRETGKIASAYWPGFALLLSPFMRMGLPWLLNPLLAVIALGLLWYVARSTVSHPQAPIWAVLLLLASPAFTVNAVSFYSMNAHLCLNLAFAACLLKLTPKRLLAAGAVGSFALVLHNPYPHLLFAVPWVFYVASRSPRARNFFLLALGYLPLSLVLGFGWMYFRRQIIAPVSPEPVASTGPWLEVIRNAVGGAISRTFLWPDEVTLIIRAIDTVKLFVWLLPGLPLLALCYCRVRERKDVVLDLFGLSALLTFLGYFAVSYGPGDGWGYRYFHSALGALPLLAARFLLDERTPIRWRQVIAPLAVMGLLLGTALRFGQVRHYIDDKSANLPCLDRNIPHVCFIERDLRDYYRMRNDAFLGEPRIVMLSFGDPADSEMLKSHFPGGSFLTDLPGSRIWRRAREKATASPSGSPGRLPDRGAVGSASSAPTKN